MTAGWGARTVRAAVFAAVCVLLAALGHAMMAGEPMPPGTLAAGWAGTAVAGWCLAGRERGLLLVVTVVLAAQAALHAAFSFVPSAGGCAALDAMDMDATGTASMHMGSMHVSHTGTGLMDHADHMAHSVTGGSYSPGMLAAHLLAALLCGLWLGYGERAAFRLLRAVAGRLAAPLRLLGALPAPPHRPLLRMRRRRSDRAPRLLLLVHAITTRGPPTGSAAV
ncbi:hypothetical protein [Streptomyces sp. TRM68367]|uniref:hypothetical protein n=1 Tax=Streptomyces sp. TRM68367 TaxID=2758415 RepID=UPI00165B4201|nr:hypothetical protein [Streptomyces sp. TRM68367]MBC9727616.1 hypothetical protein [Streptomyces sp. TRM68367]